MMLLYNDDTILLLFPSSLQEELKDSSWRGTLLNRVQSDFKNDGAPSDSNGDSAKGVLAVRMREKEQQSLNNSSIVDNVHWSSLHNPPIQPSTLSLHMPSTLQHRLFTIHHHHPTCSPIFHQRPCALHATYMYMLVVCIR